MPQCYDEPIADISILPTYLVSELAAQGNKAVMGGEGADELLGGYHWQHSWNLRQTKAWNRWNYKPGQLLSHYVDNMSMGLFDRHELAMAAGTALTPHLHEDPFWFYRRHVRTDLPSQKALQWLDIRSFMGELVLTKIDRASMAHSLEVRVPFLDHELVEFLFHLPTSMIWQKDHQKPLLESFLSPHIPSIYYNRPKQGFVGPDPFYMNKELYRKGLKNSLLVQQGWIKAEYIEQQLNQDYNWRLWKLLILENWLKHWT
jgi:asparagine synthase (glutamine-hydrolysing)